MNSDEPLNSDDPGDSKHARLGDSSAADDPTSEKDDVMARRLDELATLRSEILTEAQTISDAPGVSEVRGLLLGTDKSSEAESGRHEGRVVDLSAARERSTGEGHASAGDSGSDERAGRVRRRSSLAGWAALAAAAALGVTLFVNREAWFGSSPGDPANSRWQHEVFLGASLQPVTPLGTVETLNEFVWTDSSPGPRDYYRVTVRDATNGRVLLESGDLEETRWRLSQKSWKSEVLTWDQWTRVTHVKWEVVAYSPEITRDRCGAEAKIEP